MFHLNKWDCSPQVRPHVILWISFFSQHWNKIEWSFDVRESVKLQIDCYKDWWLNTTIRQQILQSRETCLKRSGCNVRQYIVEICIRVVSQKRFTVSAWNCSHCSQCTLQEICSILSLVWDENNKSELCLR